MRQIFVDTRGHAAVDDVEAGSAGAVPGAVVEVGRGAAGGQVGVGGEWRRDGADVYVEGLVEGAREGAEGPVQRRVIAI